MEGGADVDSDLELGIALSLSQQEADAADRPVAKPVRRRLLPPVTVGARSKKLLRNVYRSDQQAARRIDAVVHAAFRTLHTLGDQGGDSSAPLDTDALQLALKRLGYAVDDAQLQDMLQCYASRAPPAAARLSEFALYTRETVGGRNVEAEWRPEGAGAAQFVEEVDVGTLREIFLDCKLRMENNGLIY
ncbi:formin homology 2 domain containing protein, putative [Babesia caballi]|uniref:Formin homology 2 domain containing protein, putative n=1 Tax=Babesia caballi TaxID=5871 RepID=A0AAV4M0E2_BABCB|nr:formin homology 2 domain containing protein, putative [Babesia caballi]